MTCQSGVPSWYVGPNPSTHSTGAPESNGNGRRLSSRHDWHSLTMTQHPRGGGNDGMFMKQIVACACQCSKFCNHIAYTLHGTAIYAAPLTTQNTPTDRHIWQSHGAFGLVLILVRYFQNLALLSCRIEGAISVLKDCDKVKTLRRSSTSCGLVMPMWTTRPGQMPWPGSSQGNCNDISILGWRPLPLVTRSY